MTKIIFIHGINNKPAKSELIKIWLTALQSGGSSTPKLKNFNQTNVDMLYWADLIYPQPILPTDPPDMIDRIDARSLSDNEFVKSIHDLKTRIGALFHSAAADDLIAVLKERAERGLDALLPEFAKSILMMKLAHDTFLYLNNQPAPNQPQQNLRDLIHERFVSSVKAAGGDYIVVSHSQGTVIAYDCLKHLIAAHELPKARALVTLGSPLGLTEVRAKLGVKRGGDAFPSNGVAGAWVNIADDCDIVDGLDPNLRDDYQQNGSKVITDLSVENPGRWKHSIEKYFHQPLVQSQIDSLL